ncbi:uncharacterized protein LOC114279329 isoform X2 [Camellia sinensis]|uniref:uncharacterized protein LOC114279329 isoform X2 n=1 Tax=Camellia sinensis TaxID=4442 RepID=UPI001036814F|nr:uncharacterized protein LOC114279329 isoform X2 [Camellia sinensis]XP_028077360.1 uncharacterized protein LOC114279329 isoform X2 [Camellia sinensis]XP_028077361.1 uncharacterized protein LOC114279329 isoform X2 [Camellia sinensis]
MFLIFGASQSEMKLFGGSDRVALKLRFGKKIVELEDEKRIVQNLSQHKPHHRKSTNITVIKPHNHASSTPLVPVRRKLAPPPPLTEAKRSGSDNICKGCTRKKCFYQLRRTDTKCYY